MPSKIPLLRLPLLPFEQILDSLNLKDLIELSLFSKKMYNRIHSSQLVKFNDVQMRVEGGVVDEVHLKSDQLGIFLITSMRKERDEGCLQTWYTKERFTGKDEKGIPIFQIHDWDRKNSANDFLFWVQYLRELFNVITYSSIIFWSKEPIDFDKYFKRTDLIRNAKRILMTGGFPMSHEEMEFLLDNLTTDALELDVSLQDPGNFEYNKKIRFPHLKMPDFSWLSEDQLLDLLKTTSGIEVKNTKVLTESFLNKFLKQWFNSSNDTLQEVQIWSKPCSKSSKVPVFDKKKVLEGITGRVETDFLDDDPEEESLEPGMTITRDENFSMTIQVEKRGKRLHFQFILRDWRRLFE